MFSCVLLSSSTTTDSYTLSLHDALPIFTATVLLTASAAAFTLAEMLHATISWELSVALDRKSTRLNSSHRCISYAVFCLKKKTDWQAFPPLRAGRRRVRPVCREIQPAPA